MPLHTPSRFCRFSISSNRVPCKVQYFMRPKILWFTHWAFIFNLLICFMCFFSLLSLKTANRKMYVSPHEENVKVEDTRYGHRDTHTLTHETERKRTTGQVSLRSRMRGKWHFVPLHRQHSQISQNIEREKEIMHWFCGIDRSLINKLHTHNVNEIANQTEECARNHFTNDIFRQNNHDRAAHGTNGWKHTTMPSNDLQNRFF